jgi:hypothetical protein
MTEGLAVRWLRLPGQGAKRVWQTNCNRASTPPRPGEPRSGDAVTTGGVFDEPVQLRRRTSVQFAERAMRREQHFARETSGGAERGHRMANARDFIDDVQRALAKRR